MEKIIPTLRLGDMSDGLLTGFLFHGNQLSRTRKVVVKKFKGKVFVDIREYYNKDGLDLPGKKGLKPNFLLHCKL